MLESKSHFIMSLIKRDFVILLNPNFSSITKVEYHENGSVIRVCNSVILPKKASASTIGFSRYCLQKLSKAPKPQKISISSITKNDTVPEIQENLYFVRSYF